MLERYQIEDKQLINDMLKRNFYQDFQLKNPNKKIEFIINNSCPNNCTNCYLTKNNNNIYPTKVLPINENQILINFNKFIEWYIYNNFYADIELLGNQWLNNDLLNIKIFEILYKNYSNTIYKPKIIFIRSNMQFLFNININHTIQNFINEFNKIGIHIKFLAYINGKYCDNNIYTDEQYQIIFNFIKNNNGNIISYITPDNVQFWINNYKWWISTFSQEVFQIVKLEELKNDSWNLDNITQFISFLDFQSDYFIDNFSKNDILNLIFNNKDNIKFTNCYLFNSQILDNTLQFKNCNFHNALTINVQTGQIITCPKINYDDFIIGVFDMETMECNPQNLELLIFNTHLKRSSTPHCETCNYLSLCEGFCYGESFNVNYNIIIPILESCKFTYSKINFLLYKYTLLNLLTNENIKTYSNDKLYDTILLKFIKKIKENMPNERKS